MHLLRGGGTMGISYIGVMDAWEDNSRTTSVAPRPEGVAGVRGSVAALSSY